MREPFGNLYFNSIFSFMSQVFMMKGFKLSKVPVTARRKSPPFGARGLTYSRCGNSALYFISPCLALPCWGIVLRSADRLSDEVPKLNAMARATVTARRLGSEIPRYRR